MNYADLTARIRQDLGVSYDFTLAVLKEMGYTRPMEAVYSERDYERIKELVIIKRHEARSGTRPREVEARAVPLPHQTGLWFRAAPYRFLEGGWIAPAPKAQVEEFPLEEVLDDAVPALVELGRDVQLVQEKGNKRIEIGPKSRDKFIAFYNRFGPLGLGLRDVWEIKVWPLEGRITVSLHPTLTWEKEIREHFGPAGYEKYARPRRRKGPGGLKVERLTFDWEKFLLNYREDGFTAAMEAVSFSLCARQLARGEPPGLLELRLGLMEDALQRSRPKVSHEGGTLRLVWEPNSLIDAAYARLYETVVRGEAYRACADPKCGKLFKQSRGGKGRRRLYCSEKCKTRHNQERFRASR